MAKDTTELRKEVREIVAGYFYQDEESETLEHEYELTSIVTIKQLIEARTNYLVRFIEDKIKGAKR